MRQHAEIASDDLDSSDVLAFLRLRGIVPENGHFTEQQLGRELHRYGWRWASTPEGVTAEKAYPRPGETPERIVARQADPVRAFVEVLAAAIQADEARGRWPAGQATPRIRVTTLGFQTIALVEPRGGVPFTAEEAEQYRITLWRWYVSYSQAPFLLLTTGDRGFLWDQRDQENSYYQKATQFSISSVLNHYLPTWSEDDILGRYVAQNVIFRWLDDLSWTTPGPPPPLPQELVDSPFIEAVFGSVVESDQSL